MPQIFNPLLTSKINAASEAEIGRPKYPDFVLNDADTGEKFGTGYILHTPEEWDLLLQGEDTSDDSDTECLDSGLQEEVTHLIELWSGALARAETLVEADFSSTDVLGVPHVEETATISRRDLEHTTPSEVGLGTPEVPLVGTRKRRDDDSTTERVKSKQRPAARRRSTFSGLVTPLAPERWTSEMKGIINKLLVTTKPPNRYQKVTEEYNRMVYDRADDPLSSLKITNTHFIQFYDRQVSRKLEGLAITNVGEKQVQQMKDLMDTLQEPATVRAHIVSPTPERPPVIAPAPAYQFIQLGHLAAPRQPPTVAYPVASPPTRKRKRKGPAEADVPTETGPSQLQCRLCSYCRQPKSKRIGVGNLHDTFVRKAQKGQACFFYCPAMMSDIYGTPKTMSFPEFKQTEHFAVAWEAAVQRRIEKDRKKAEAAATRLAKGWKKPGGSKKKT
eukprot:Seg7615.2 transcript_id=Seg7615.2/GoldUCD/mRNA.D3Y31 product="hypothetical protein" protein_id=Seg7615.2/GoldUCD/D3Y31